LIVVLFINKSTYTIKIMKLNRALLSLTCAGVLLLPGVGMGEPAVSDQVLISEILVGSSSSASEEFIEIYNNSSASIDISDFKLEYFSASTTTFTTPSRSIVLNGSLAPGQYYLVASTGYLSELANNFYSSGLAKIGGHIRLVDTDSTVHDLVGWGTAATPETTAAPAPDSGMSLQRKIDLAGAYIDTNNNSNDFDVNSVPSPQAYLETVTPEPEPAPTEEPAVIEPSEEEAPTTTTLDTEAAATESPTTLPLQITELLPNPASPQTDDQDEFIELFNPNNESIDLEGYKLQAGNSFSYSFTFDTQSIAPGSYLAIYVRDSDVLLANGGSKARLVSSAGEVVSETEAYEDADDGEAWALIGGIWQWTITPTPNQANVLSFPELTQTSKTTAAKKSSTKKTATTKSATTKKPKAAKTTVPKTPKQAAENASGEEESPTEIAPVHSGLLAGVGTVALGYGAYEYRKDMSNFLYRLRRYRSLRRAARAKL
jgi:hypothetical protein